VQRPAPARDVGLSGIAGLQPAGVALAVLAALGKFLMLDFPEGLLQQFIEMPAIMR